MSWNVVGSFAGTLETMVPPATTTDDDTRSLVFSTFLAMAVLPSGPSYKEVKFSGNTEIGCNSGAVGEAVDTFAHHVVITSEGTVLFADLQGDMTSCYILHIYLPWHNFLGVVGPGSSVVLFDPQAHTLVILATSTMAANSLPIYLG